MSSSTMFDQTFEALFKSLDPSADPKAIQSSRKNFDPKSKSMQYYNAEKDFIRIASEVDMEMRAKVSAVDVSRESLQPTLNDVFARKPKRQIDKSTISNEMKSSFVNIFDKMNLYWEASESKRNIGLLFDIRPDGDRDPSTTPPNNNVEENTAPATRKNHPLSSIATNNLGASNLTDESPSPSPSPFHESGHGHSKNAKNSEAKLGNSLQVQTKGLAPTDIRMDGKTTPAIFKEDSLDTSGHLKMMKPPVTMNQLAASREHLDESEKVEESREAREARMEDIRRQEAERDRVRKEEEDRRRNEDRARREEEEKRKKDEQTKKKVDRWMEKMPDFSQVFSQNVIDKKKSEL